MFETYSFNEKCASSCNSTGIIVRWKMADSPSSVIKPPKSNGRKSCSNFNILSPQLKEPFYKGWRREVVYRTIVGNEKRNMCDIYYFSPNGKKLRSGREISDYLNQTKSSFSVENFTFCKEPIGMDVKHEVVRFARAMGRRNVGTIENTSPKTYLTVRAHRKRVLQRTDQKDDGDVKVVTTKDTTPKPSTQVIDNDKTSSKQTDIKRLTPRCSARKASQKESKLNAQPTTGKAKLPPPLHSSICTSDSDHRPTPSDDEELKSTSGSSNQIFEDTVHGQTVVTTKETTSKASTPVIENDKTSSKQIDVKRPNTRRSARQASLKERKLKAQPRTGKAKLPPSLHPSTCKSDGDRTSTSSDNEVLKSPSGSPDRICEDNVESPVQQSPALTPELPETLPETLPLTSPLIALLPLGTILILSDSQTVRIIPPNLNSISTSVKRSERISPKVSLPPVASESVATNFSSVNPLRHDALTSLNSVKFSKNVKSISCSSLIRRILSPRPVGFAVPSRPSAYEDQIPQFLFRTENCKRSYWASIGQAIIEEGLQRATLLQPCQVNPPIKKNPVRSKRKKWVLKKNRGTPKPPPPTVSVILTCKDYFALRKERRQQQLNSHSSVTASCSRNN